MGKLATPAAPGAFMPREVVPMRPGGFGTRIVRPHIRGGGQRACLS